MSRVRDRLVVLDLEDYPDAKSLDPSLIRKKIIPKILNFCYRDLEVLIYVDVDTYSEELRYFYCDSGLCLRSGGFHRILIEGLRWGRNDARSDVIILSKKIEEQHHSLSGFRKYLEKKSFKVVLALPNEFINLDECLMNICNMEELEQVINLDECTDLIGNICTKEEEETTLFSPISENEFKDVFEQCHSFTMYSDCETIVFWNVEDYPIPNGMDFAKTVQNIKEALKKKGCFGEVSINAYVDENTFSEYSNYSDDGTKIIFFPKGENKQERAHFIVFDVVLYTLENPSPSSNLILLSKNIIRRDVIYRFVSFSRRYDFKILLSFDCAEPRVRQQLLVSNKIADILHSDSECAIP